MLGKVLKSFTTNVTNVKFVKVIEVKNDTKRINIKYQIKKVYFEKTREKILQKQNNR